MYQQDPFDQQAQGPAGRPEAQEERRRRPRTQWLFKGQQVCSKAFCSLLGIGQERLYKDIALTLDMRSYVGRSLPRECPKLEICERFFRDLYSSAAEPLPYEFHIHKGSDSEVQGPGSGPTSNDDSEDEGSEEDHVSAKICQDWNPDKPLHEIIGECVGNDPEGLVTRELPTCALSDLYWQLLAYCSDMKVKDDDAPSYTTLRRCWAKWSQVLRLKAPSSHAKCQTCFE